MKAQPRKCKRHRILLFALLCILPVAAQAQTIPLVTGTFKTPAGQTPVQAGLAQVATINATAVYGSIDFVPTDSAGNRPTRILCGGITYLPQPVRGWVKGDGTLVDNNTAASGVSLVPTIGCTPAGLVYRAKATMNGTADGRIPSVTWTEDKGIPQQVTADWGSLAASGITAPAYTGYATVQNIGTSLAARNTINFTGGGCVDNPGSTRTDCTLAGGGGSSAWSSLTNPALDEALSLGAFKTTFTSAGGTAPVTPWNFAETWNLASFAGPFWKVNITDTSSAAGALLFDWQIGGVSKIKVDKNGLLTTAVPIPIASGGLNNGAAPSSDGQIPIWNAAQLKYVPGDPIISFNFANLHSASAATGTLTSSATRVSTFSQYGTLYITWAGITGSPSGCTIQIKSGDSLGNFLNNGSALAVTPANGTTSQTFTPAAALTTAGQMQSVFACSVYPTAGTLSLEFVPSITVNVPNTIAVSAASLPLPTGAATEATLSALNTKIPASPAQDRITAAAPSAVRLTDGAAFYKGTTPADTQPVSAASLPLPAGAATETTLSALNTKINTEIAADYDTGAGVQTMKFVGLALPASGGAVAGGTAANPIRIDPTGATTQPVSAASLPLPAGAATETTLGTRLADATFTARINTQGQKAMAASTPVVLPSDQAAIPVNATPVAITASGTIIATDGTVTVGVGGYGSVGIQITGTWTATALFEASIDGTNYQALEAWPSNSATSATSSAANGVWNSPVGGFNQVRVRANPFTSGTLTVSLRASNASPKMLAAGGTGGTSSSFASAFPGTGTAAGLKATAAAPTYTEGNMQAFSSDLGGLMRVRCDTGCAAAGDTAGTSGSLNALNAAVSVALAGENGTNVIFTGAAAPVLTVVAEVSPDAGTTWFSAVFLDPVSGATSTSLVNPANGQWQIGYAGAQSNARVRVSAFTSGSITGQLRATVTRPWTFVYGSDGTNLRAIRTATDGTVRIDPTGTTIQPISAASLPLPAGASTSANQTATQPRNVAQWNGVALGSPSTYGTSPGAVNVPGVNAFITNTPAVTLTSTTITGTVDVSDRAARLVGQVEGRAASGAAKAGNPNQIGGVFNTTQPTVTTGQAVEQQMTARGAQIVAAGVEALNVTVSAALPAGAAVIGALSANQSVNVAQINGIAPLMGNGVTGTGSPRVTLASDNSNAAGIGGSATGSAVPSAARYMAGAASGAAGAPLLTGVVLCDQFKAVNIVTAATTVVIPLVASKTTYICGWHLFSAGIDNVALVFGTGASCATGIAGIAGGTTAATGYNFTAQTGIVVQLPMGSPVKETTVAADTCIITSGAVQLSGMISYAQF
jgi:hypothetical protein